MWKTCHFCVMCLGFLRGFPHLSVYWRINFFSWYTNVRNSLQIGRIAACLEILSHWALSLFSLGLQAMSTLPQ